MSNVLTHIQAIKTAIEGEGYVYTKEVFDFDNVPNSKINKAYRFIPGLGGQEDEVGRVKRLITFEVWACFKIGARGDRETTQEAVITAGQTLKDKITQALTDYPVYLESMEWEEYTSAKYIVINISGYFEHWRNL
jgi:hypothetical protein